MAHVYLYSSERNVVIAGTDNNGENRYMTNNNQFTVFTYKCILTTLLKNQWIYPN